MLNPNIYDTMFDNNESWFILEGGFALYMDDMPLYWPPMWNV